jgi:hypothetical protein
METQNNPNSKRNPKQKKQQWRFHNTSLQITLQNHRNKNRMVLTQKQETKTNVTKQKIPK